MTLAASSTARDVPAPGRSLAPDARLQSRAFFGQLEPIILEDPAPFRFAGSLTRSQADAIWLWVQRDLCPDFFAPEAARATDLSTADAEAAGPELLGRIKQAFDTAATDKEADRRLRLMLGHGDAIDAIPTVITALRNRALLGKAQAFGRAVNAMTDDAALGQALLAMPRTDPAAAAVLFHAVVGQVGNPTRLVTATIRIVGNAEESAIMRMGFGPLLDAIMAHAQNVLHLLQPAGAFADIDLTCRGLERFHRLMRALTGNIELSRTSQRTQMLSALTKQVSGRIEPRLRDILPDLNQALRQHGDATHDRLDADRLLAALNGIYLLRTIRDCRDSLALNAAFDQAWAQCGQALDLQLQRNLDLLRQSPADPILAARLDAGIKMAELRYNADYAETLRRARASAERRP